MRRLSLLLFLLPLVTACKESAQEPPAPATAGEVLARTDRLLAQAADAAREGGQGHSQYRGAWMRQQAAKKAAEKGNEALAAKLSVQARKHAAKALLANSVAPEDALVEVRPAEKALAKQADDTEHNEWMEQAEKDTPSAAELLQAAPEADLQPRTAELLERTDAVLEMARAAAAGGTEKEKYRVSWVRQEAARRALAANRPRIAAKFSLISRRHAGQVLEANGVEIPPGLRETPEEKSIKLPVENNPDSEVDPMLAEVEKTCPPLEELLEGAK